MQALSDKQVNDLLATIQDRYLAFIVEIAGPKSVRPEELARLQKLGLVKKSPMSLVRQAYEFGTLAAAMSEPDLAALDYDHFAQQLLQGNAVPLTYEEKSAVKHLERTVAGRVKGLGNKLEQGTNQIIVEADQKLRRRLAGRVKKEMVAGVEHRRTVAQIASNLARATGDQARDWMRVASTEIHNAFLEGRADHIIATNKGRDPLVFKRPRPDACPRCITLYLEHDLVTPKIFHLSELVANGTTNEGRKVGQWLPTLGCVHPYCFPAGVSVLTERGRVAIEDVTTDDLVMTHTGKWRRVTQLHRNHHAGWLVNVGGTHSTASHPILTQRGWVPAEALQGGDYFIDCEREILLAESQNGEAKTGELLRLGRILSALSMAVVPVPTVDLHGQLVRPVPEVDVVLVHGHEGRERQAIEGLLEPKLQVGELGGYLSSLCDVHSVLPRLLLASHGIMGRASELAALLRSQLGVTSQLAFAGGPGRHAVQAHVPVDGVSVGVEHPRHLQYGALLGEMQTPQQGGREVGSWLSGRHTVIESYNDSKRKWHNGLVYNLSVWGDESYIADGKVVHNCQCILHELPDGFGFDTGGNMVYQGIP